jgi:CRISPR-associated protein Cmr2
MARNPDDIWRIKFAARTHDPAEKALVLLRDPAGHEGGTVRAIQRLAGLATYDAGADGAAARLSAAEYALVQRADWWAAAADRPQWPMQEIEVKTRDGTSRTLAVAPWAQVRWTAEPQLIHPLSGETCDLKRESGGLSETDFADIKERSFDHQQRLIATDGATTDWRKSALALWRFGPDLVEADDRGKLGELWKLLPADTRVPDHSIWDHLDLVSAFAGAFAADAAGDAALLAVSIGPVQTFIESARTTSDLWAGSHLLSRLMWEALKPLAEACGPDAVVFPRLRGIPQVDLWLRDECGLPDSFFENADWKRGTSDANPLFAAALPNRFVAIVPADQAESLARRAAEAARNWLRDLGATTVDQLLEVGGVPRGEESEAHRQMRRQLEGFPEVHWSVVPFSLVRARDVQKQTDLDVAALARASAPFFGAADGAACGFLDSPAWRVLNADGGLKLEGGTRFFAPNPGVLYPALLELAERALAAAKAARPFDARREEGWRCSLTGETEWLTTDRAQLTTSHSRQTDTLWTRVAKARPAWARKGEHLGGLPAVKRVWPTLFAREAGQHAGDDALARFVVSTHTMALATQLRNWMERGAYVPPQIQAAIEKYSPQRVALPRGLVKVVRDRDALRNAGLIVGLLEAADGLEDDGSRPDAQVEADKLRRVASEVLADGARLETYYGMLLMDGDRMGEWMAGGVSQVTYQDSFHSRVRVEFDRRAKSNAALARYAAQPRALSPGRHLAISGALNDFSLTIARHVVEEEHLGRLVYAGGDDVLAMLPVKDLLPAMQRLRDAYSGNASTGEDTGHGLRLNNGHALLDGKLMRMMGNKATASSGAVIAHHQAPLAAVLRELRDAEKRAKSEGGRDAFSLSVIKRSGGVLRLTAKWNEPLRLVCDLRDFLAAPEVSRRAVYNSLEWLKDLPADNAAMWCALLGQQLQRQARGQDGAKIAVLAARLTEQAMQAADPRNRLGNLLSVAEFLARETRTGA